MKVFPALLLSFLLATTANAQEYSTLLLPDSLVKGADIIKRSEEYILTIKSNAKYSLSEKHVYSILNAGGNGYASYQS
ncbi:MAG: hypothetical protein EOO07_17805, partial [Chitinophagaceae bacterium]